MGLGTLILIAIFVTAICVSISEKQAFAGWLTAIGLLLLGYFGLSVVLGESLPVLALPYRVVNIYVFLFVAVIFTVAGSIGLFVRMCRHFRHD